MRNSTTATWTEQQKLVPILAFGSDQFGFSVDISGDTIVIGANRDNVPSAGADSGSAFVFTRSGSVWTQQQQLTASDGAGFDAGAVYVFEDGALSTPGVPTLPMVPLVLLVGLLGTIGFGRSRRSPR